MMATGSRARKTYRTLTGRDLDFGDLTPVERGFRAAVRQEFECAPEWSAFAGWWAAKLRQTGLTKSSIPYRICQDLEARLGIAPGKVAAPDYRDYLADLIEVRYGSRYRFCKETGVDPGHLSRVFAGRSELSVQSLQRVADALGAALIIVPIEEVGKRPRPRPRA